MLSMSVVSGRQWYMVVLYQYREIGRSTDHQIMRGGPAKFAGMMDDAEARSEKNLTNREQKGYEVTPLVAAA